MLNILFEDQSIIVAEKPVGLESQATRKLEPDMVSEIRKHIHKLSTPSSGKKGEPYVGVIHRLDRPVGGIMVYAKTKEAAAALSRQVQDRTMEKYYLAIVCGKPVDNVGNFVDFLLKDGKINSSFVVDKTTDGAKRAELEYRVINSGVLDGREVSLAEVHLLTGRHHQIRVQFASRGLPLWGDEKYGNREKKSESGEETGQNGGSEPVLPARTGVRTGVPAGSGARTGRRRMPSGRETPALYAFRLEFRHPVTGEVMKFEKWPETGAFRRYEEQTRF